MDTADTLAADENDGAHAPALRAALAEVQAALQACEARMALAQGALRALPDGVASVDLRGRITQFNPGASHLTGWSETEALGQPLHEVLQLRDAHGRGVGVLGPDAKAGQDVISLVRRDRHVVLVDVTCASILDDARQAVGAVVTFRNVTAAKRINDELTWHASHDPLTGVVNRRVFESSLKRAVTNAAAHGTPHVLLYLDLDRFKTVNDVCGHDAGDELLRQLAVLLKRPLRERDTLARLGGDEFAVLLEHCTPEQSGSVAERLRSAVRNHQFSWQGKVLEVGLSIGQVTFRDGALTPETLLRRADEMCYAAKSAGRNQVRAHSPGKANPVDPKLRPAQARGTGR